jgi:CHAT domain-containing protein
VTQQQNYVTYFLKPALRTVWNNILVHIFEKLGIALVDTAVLPERQICWYPTGPLTFIPIHAARSRAIDVSHLVISSYVITLGFLFKVQKKYRRLSEGENKLLTISQPETPGESSLPKTMEEVDEVALAFRSLGWSDDNIVCLWGSEATVKSVSSALNSCSWVHFACHGFQHPILGMKCAFALHDGQLELNEIASKNLSNGQFAFLSACQAASGLKDLPGEAMHLAAGLQFAGFPSVIATMWSICDNDALKVANHTYQYLLRNGLQGLDPAEAATALNRAILHLQEDPSITVDQWAPFIHFGI